MELNQLLQNLLNASGANDVRALPKRALNELTRIVDADSAKVLMQELQRRAGTSPSDLPPASGRSPDATLSPSLKGASATLARLPVVPVQITISSANAAKQQPAQVILQIDLGNSKVSLPIPITRSQQQSLQNLQQQSAQQPLLLVATKASPTMRNGQPQEPLLQLQIVSPRQPKQPVNLQLPVAQLPKPVAQTLLATSLATATTAQPSSSSQPTAAPILPGRSERVQPASVLSPSQNLNADVPPSRPVRIDHASQGTMLKQATQTSPQQFQQAIQQLISQSAPPTALPKQPEQALTRMLQAVVQQMPAGESMQQPQQLRQWVNDWFAAKPVASSPQQQMGSLGKMLMMLLGMAVQKSPANATSPSLSPLQQHNANQLTHALIDQILRPAPRASGETNFTGEARDRINQLLMQLPQTQLQRLMQLFTSALNSAQTSQARLGETSAATPEYFVLLPASAQQNEQQHELLIRREHERGQDGEAGRTVWLFTMRFELKEYGPLLVKGRYHPAGTRIDFYTESVSAEKTLQQHIEKLAERFATLDVNGLKLNVQQGKVPETLAKQKSGIIRVTV